MAGEEEGELTLAEIGFELIENLGEINNKDARRNAIHNHIANIYVKSTEAVIDFPQCKVYSLVAYR